MALKELRRWLFPTRWDGFNHLSENSAWTEFFLGFSPSGDLIDTSRELGQQTVGAGMYISWHIYIFIHLKYK
jgi:hypothetical protein